MAKTVNSYVLPQDNRTVNCVLTAAKASHNSSTDAVKLFDAGANGSLLKRCWALPRATVANSKLALYISPDNGATVYLLDSIQMTAYTEAADTSATKTEFTGMSDDEPIYVPSGSSVWAASRVALAGGIVVTGLVEDY